TAPPSRPESKAVEDRVLEHANQVLERELEREPTLRDQDDLMNPFETTPTHGRGLRNPFENDGAPRPELDRSLAPGRQSLRDYGAAIEAYRRALSRQVEDVSESYQRGVQLVLAADERGAERAWSSIKLQDARVDAARRSIEKVRALIASRR